MKPYPNCKIRSPITVIAVAMAGGWAVLMFSTFDGWLLPGLLALAGSAAITVFGRAIRNQLEGR